MTILNTTGAENLLGRGDSLLLEENGNLTRILGAYVSDDDIMQTLEPYRCEIKEPQPTNVVVVSGDNNNITVQQTIKQEQQNQAFGRVLPTGGIESAAAVKIKLLIGF